MPRVTLSTVLFLTILPAALGWWGCAKRSEQTPEASEATATSPAGDALLEVSRSDDDTTPIAPPSLAPGDFQGPPLKPRISPRASLEGETVAPPTAIPDAAGSSSSSSDVAAPRELLEQDASLSPTLKIDPARLFRRREEWTEAETAADALGRIGAPATAEILAMLDDPSPTVRKRGAEILARIGADAEEAIAPLIRVVEQDPDPQVRKAAAFALGQMGPTAAAAVPVLTRMLREAN